MSEGIPKKMDIKNMLAGANIDSLSDSLCDKAIKYTHGKIDPEEARKKLKDGLNQLQQAILESKDKPT